MGKIKFELEFPIHASSSMLYQYFSTPSGLSEWFADNVISKGNTYTFIWDDTEEMAKLLQNKVGEKVRFKWESDDSKESYFEFNIQTDAITKDVSLIITDFANEDEVEESKILWENQINELKNTIGA